MQSSNYMHAECMRPERRMAQEGAYELRSIAIEQIEPYQTIRGVQKFAPEVILIMRKEGRSVKLLQGRDDLGVFDTRMFNIDDQASKLNPPSA